MTGVLAPFTLGMSPFPGPRMQRPDPRHVVLEVEPAPDLPRLGRPPVGPRISTCVTVETLAQIERLAEEWHVSRAEAARVLIGWGITSLLRPPQDREHDLLRSEIEASAEAQGLSPAALLGVGYGAVLARRGGK